MFVVYILFLRNNRLYVGQTKRWRLQTRWEEHLCPNFVAARWTSKYPPIAKGSVFEANTLDAAKQLEHELVILLMSIFGLDSVRGGRFNMATEGESWWVPKELKHVPRFTSIFYDLCEHTFFAWLGNVPSQERVCQLSLLRRSLRLLS